MTRVNDQLQVMTTEAQQADRGAGTRAGTAQATADVEPSVRTRVLARYFVLPELKRARVDVTSDRAGVVRLEGNVESKDIRRQAEQAASGVEGVTRVENRLRVRNAAATGSGQVGTSGAPSAGAASSSVPSRPDDALRTMVQAKYFTHDETKAQNIDVKVSEGVVTLSGTVTAEARREAVSLARDTEGVRRVEDKLEVGPAGQGDSAAARRAESVAANVRDGWITTKLQANYFVDPDIKGRNIDVDTRAQVVTLTGTVESAAEK